MSAAEGGLIVLAIGLALLAAAGAVVVVGDLIASRDWEWLWTSEEREDSGIASPSSRSSGASDGSRESSLCDGCGRAHPAEALPLELLLAGGVAVDVGRWFGWRRVV